MPDPICVRFAPSPTGFLHVGGVRTALFNWLYARSKGGKFTLRIEDTDRERSKQEFTDQILESLQWLGLDLDAEPVFQSRRGDMYRDVLDKMLQAGTAFRCFVPQEESRKAVDEAKKKDGQAAYFSPDRNLAPEESQRRADAGEPFVIRLKCPEGQTVFNDLIRGPIEVSNSTIGDIVLARSDGNPTYNYVVVVDDHDMGISHVVRGEDHIPNTPKQIQVFRAMGWPEPLFAHLPLILGPDKAKLSKRHGAVTTDQYQMQGILPVALKNYMALLGWSPGDDREVFTVEELVRDFSLERVNKSASVFDHEKLRWLNGVHLRNLDDASFVEWARQTPAYQGHPKLYDKEWFHAAALLGKERARTWDELVFQLEPFMEDDLKFDEKAVAKHLGKPTAKTVLEEAAALLERAEDFTDHEGLEQLLREMGEKLDLKFGLIVHPCRVAMTGRDKGPGLTEVMVCIGKRRTVDRMRAAVALCGSDAPA